MKKLLLTYVALLILSLSASAQTSKIFNSWSTDFDPFYDSSILYGLSSNGQYAVGWGETTGISLMWNKTDNALTDIYATADEDKIDAHGYDVSDKGTVVGSFVGGTFKDAANRFCLYPGYRTLDGVWHDVELLGSVMVGSGKSGYIAKVSKDDVVMGGSSLTEDKTKLVPVIWKNGVIQKPLVDIGEYKVFNMTAMSEDGTVWAGFRHNSSFLTDFVSYDAIIYANGEIVEIPFTDYPEEVYNHRTYVSSISENGKYAAGSASYRVETESGSDCVAKGFIYNIETKSLTWIDGIVPSVVTNDGTLYGRDINDDILGALGSTLKIANAVIYKNGKVSNFKEYMVANFGLSATDAEKVAMSDITGVSEIKDDAFTIAGYSTRAGGMGNERICKPFIITVDLQGATGDIVKVIENDKLKVSLFDSSVTNNGFFNGISGNGNYIVGGISNSYGFVYNTNTGLVKTVEGAEYTNSSNETKTSCNLSDISNDGNTIVGSFVDEGSVDPSTGEECVVAGYYKDGEWHKLNRVDNVPLMANGYDGFALAVSSDGSIIAGGTPTAPYKYSAVTWNADGTIKTLFPGCENVTGGVATCMSGDGKILGGWVENAGNYGYAAIWTEDGVNVFGKDDDYTGLIEWISENGKYAVGQYTNDYENYPQGCGLVYDIEAKKSTVISVTHEGATGCVLTGISNDGKVIVGYSMFSSTTTRKPFIIIDGVFHDLDEYISELGWETPSGYADFSLFTPLGISADGKLIYGMADNGYRLPWVINVKVDYPDAPVEPRPVYAYLNGDFENNFGFASFDINTPADYTIVAEASQMLYAGAYAKDTYYQISQVLSGPWSLSHSRKAISTEWPILSSVDAKTGESTQIANVSTYVIDMSYDYKTSKMYALVSEDYETQVLAELNLATGETTTVAPITGAPWCIALACKSDGTVYTVSSDGNLYSVNVADGVLTAISETGFVPCDFLNQSMEFDHDTDELFWAPIYEDAAKSSFVKIDTTTGASTLIADFAKGENFGGLYIPFTIFDPSGVTNTTVSKADVTIAPTLITDYVYVKGEYTSMSVFNTLGACVLSDSSKAESIDLSGLASGIYIVKVMNGSKVASFKVVKK